MKKMITVLLSVVLVLSLAGCSSAPSEDEIKAALDEGTITIEDAKSKGFIDDAWVAENYESVEAVTKVFSFDSFETTYLDGTPASSEIIEGKMCLVFFNTEMEDTLEKLAVYNDASDKMKEMGVPVLGIITDQDVDAAKEKLSDIKFPILVYNEAMQTSLKDYSEMIDKDVVSVFTKNGGFYTSWRSKVETKDLLTSAEVLVNEE